MSVTVAKFLDVSEGTQANQFSIGDRVQINSISDLDDTYKQLMDQPIPVVMAVMGGDGRPNLTPMWFDYEGDKVLVNVAEHRKKTIGFARPRKSRCCCSTPQTCTTG